MPTDEPIEYELAQADVRAWLDYVVASTLDIAAFRRRALFLIPAIVASIGFLGFGMVGAIFGLVVGALIAFFVVPLSLQASYAKRIERIMSDMPDGTIGPHTMSLHGDELRVTSSVGYAVWHRRAIRRILEDADRAYIHLAPENALILPLNPDPNGAKRALLNALRETPPPVLPPPPPG